MAVFADPCPFEGDSSSQGQSEHMQPGASVNHNCTVPPFVPIFTSVPLLFVFFFWTVHYGTLALQGGWCSLELHNSHVSHSSHVSPISYTPQEGWTDGEKEGESEKREKGGGGGEWGIWYALCMSDLYKTKPECICVCVCTCLERVKVYTSNCTRE